MFSDIIDYIYIYVQEILYNNNHTFIKKKAILGLLGLLGPSLPREDLSGGQPAGLGSQVNLTEVDLVLEALHFLFESSDLTPAKARRRWCLPTTIGFIVLQIVINIALIYKGPVEPV